MQASFGEDSFDGMTALTTAASPLNHPAQSKRRPRWLVVTLLLLGLSALYVALIYLPFQRHLWFDELLTYYIAKAQNFEVARKWDLSPPLLHILAHYALQWDHGNPLAIRLPSALAFFGGSLALCAYGMRKLGSAFGLLFLFVFWYSPSFPYATEARPYALLYGWFCCLLFFWDLSATGRSRKLALAGVAASSLLLVNTHVLAPLSLLPFAAAEAVRWRQRRRPDLLLWATLFLPLVCVLSYLPLIRSYKTIGHYPLAFQASPRALLSYYWHTFTGVAAVLILAFGAARLQARSHVVTVGRALRSPTGALFVVLSCVPVLLDLIMMRDHAPFWGRYCITSAVGLYGAAVWLLAASFRFSSRAGKAAAFAVLLLLIAQDSVAPNWRRSIHPPPQSVSEFDRIEPTLPIVAASGLTFVEMSKYEKARVLSRLYYLRDRTAALQFANATMFEDMSDFQNAFGFPGTVSTFPDFTRAHRHFLVFGTIDYPEDWLLRKLKADGAHVKLLGTFATPYKDKNLYDVQLIR